ncbi:MAG: molybdopterin molybdotransferase MoeA [Pseudomonadota bacterium]|nr:molybdopterin molybdotransferase MoeA [Pseudomonadota bacterium]
MKTLDQIAAELQGYDPQALSAPQVLDFLSRLVTPVQEKIELPLFEALGRVLAADVVSPLDVPPHDNSAMDGYAFAGDQLVADAALALQVVGTALAGKAWQGRVQIGQCVRITTGAVMPEGLDTVVPQEFVAVQADSITIPAGLLKAGDNRRLRGEDLMRGQPALRLGDLLTPARLGLAASLGLKTLTVWRPLRVAYFSTGDEILSLGEAPREGAVYDSNRYTIFGLLSRLGCQVIDLGVVRDEPALLEAAFTEAARQADAIITSGGVSVGEADHTKTMMKQLGDVAFWRIAMRPGRPMAVGRMNPVSPAGDISSAGLSCVASAGQGGAASSEKVSPASIDNPTAAASTEQTSAANPDTPQGALLFGLPGNPVAVMVTFLAFVRPALLQMMGARAEPQPLLKARSSEVIRKKPGRTEYQRGRVFTAPDGSLQVKTTGSQGSGVLRSMAEANGLIVLHHLQGNVAVGDEVDVLMFDGAI